MESAYNVQAPETGDLWVDFSDYGLHWIKHEEADKSRHGTPSFSTQLPCRILEN